MPSFSLQLIISKPIWGEYYHWGLDIYDLDEDTHWIAEALGEPYQFIASFVEYVPKSLPRFWRSIHIVQLNDIELEDIQGVVEMLPVRNDLEHWHCQNYVTDILEELEQTKLLTVTDEY